LGKSGRYNYRPVLLIFSLLFVPESPRWLVASNEKENMLMVLSITIGPEEAAIEIEAIRQSLINKKKTAFKEVFFLELELYFLLACLSLSFSK
jgi:hypothetical protein